MGTDIKQITAITTTVLLLGTSLVVAARDYVPPPSGPYQSSVVINSSREDDSQQKVYKFPSPDILLDDSNTRSEFVDQPDPLLNEAPPQNVPVMNDSLSQQRQQPTVSSQGGGPMPDAYSQWQIPQQSGQVNPGTGWYGYQGQGMAPNYNQNVWQQGPGYGYQQQYPYSYGAPYQYNGTNSPFYGMPSPWNVMNKNPFFSDK